MPELFHDLFDDSDSSLPPDLQALYQQLLEDGVSWQKEVPTMPSLDARVQELSGRDHPSISPAGSWILQATLPTIAVSGTSHGKRRSILGQSWLSRMISVAAMILVVVLLVAVFQVQGHGRLSAPAAHKSPTVTVGTISGWQKLPALAYTSERPDDSGPAVAPGDPEVIYEANAGRDWSPNDGPRFLRRTDDAGTTWHNLPFPVPASRVHWANFLVSPLDSHSVILQIADDTLSDCPVSLRVTFPGAYTICELQYFSSDGGASWKLLITPLSNLQTFGLTNLGDDSALRNQGNRLYSGVSCPDSSCIHLVLSTDGGQTWNVIDQQLHDLAPYVCNFAVATTGRTLFAVTANMGCPFSSRQPQAVLELWRSNDGGMTWQFVRKLPTPNLLGLIAVNSGNPAQPLLYAYMPKTVSVFTNKANLTESNLSDRASDIYSSANGGKSWDPSPESSFPTGFIPFAAPIGALSDGTIIASFNTQGTWSDNQDLNGSTLYGWKRGEAVWHQIAPPLTDELMVLSIEPGNNGGDTLWIFEMTSPDFVVDNYTAFRIQVPALAG